MDFCGVGREYKPMYIVKNSSQLLHREWRISSDEHVISVIRLVDFQKVASLDILHV